MLVDSSTAASRSSASAPFAACGLWLNEARSVLITGASSGIGRSAVERLGEAGWQVFAGVRDASGAQVDGLGVVVELDVTSEESIAGAREVVAERAGGRLDALVNNAGIPAAGAVETIPTRDFRDLIETNLIGQFAVTKAFLPFVRAARGRIVFIGSLGGRVAFPYASRERYLVGRGAGTLSLLDSILPSAVIDRIKQRVTASG